MKELKANMAVLGKEAAAALDAVEAQQQRLSFQRLIVMAEGERTYHQRIAIILGEAESEMVSEKQRKESAPPRPTQVSRAETSSFGQKGNKYADINIPTLQLDLKPADTSASYAGQGHVYPLIHFSPSNTMLLWDGVLWDRRGSGPIHRFDQFTDHGGGGLPSCWK
ncbi:hypothetical protein VitviT2T_022821 [Vitis vinifera]|uniref:Uncharacterized protein n=1 Tax=Vitis vinifera TaxID=29760 RepID=A0ABY9DB03_VITVI|nr:hypothetical protein VitviT2T_022821 [Vitis vinifera]